MYPILAAIFCLFSVHCLFGQTSVVYLVHKAKDTGIAAAANEKGHKESRQPFQNTEIMLLSNTNYYLLFVTPINQEGEDYFKELESTNKILKISETEIKIFHNDQTGGDETRAITTEVNPLPSDFMKNWNVLEVKISSP